MKKALKISLYCFVLSCIIALAVCYIVIPERTKFAIDIVIGYLNKPLGIIFGTTITGGLVALIVAKLISDYKIRSLNRKYEDAKLYCHNEQEKAKAYYESALKEKEQTQELLSGYNDRIETQNAYLVTFATTIPNKKVNELAKEFDLKSKVEKQELEERLTKLDNDYVSAMSEKTTIESLKSELSELRKLVEEYGKREETTND